MGKIVTIYLSDEEVRDLRDFCDENQCTQYSALKTAVKQLLSKPIQWEEEEDTPEESIEEPQDEIIVDEETEERIELPEEEEDPTSDSDDSPLSDKRRLRNLRASIDLAPHTRDEEV